MTKVMVLSSGGIDSSTCLGEAVAQYGKENVVSLTIYYGQKHDKELKAAEDVAKYYDVSHITMDLTPIFSGCDCSLLKGSDQEIPNESYEKQIAKAGGKPVSTYVPFRNGLFLSTAASVALINECSIIFYGAHSDDAAGNAYPDCSAAFNQAMGDAIKIGSGNQVGIEAPYVNLTKADVVKRGLAINVPYELTWSCYHGGEKPCGICGTCRDRQKAFELNGAIDPAL